VPGHVRIGHVAAAARPHEIDLAPFEAVDDSQAIASGRDGGLTASGHAFAKPQLFASGRVVCLHAFVPVDDKLGAAFRADEDGRAPAAVVAAARAPDFFAGFLIESDEIGIAIGIAVLHNHVIDQDWAGGGAPGAFEGSEVFGPERFAGNGIGMNAAAAEERDDHFAVGGATGRGPAIHDVGGLGLAAPRSLLPLDLAGLAIDAEDETLIAFFERGGEEDAIAPEDWRGLADARQRGFPDDVVGFPLNGQARLRGVAVLIRPAPARPVGFCNRALRDQRGDGKGQQTCFRDLHLDLFWNQAEVIDADDVRRLGGWVGPSNLYG
jgi:hypothetical protein